MAVEGIGLQYLDDPETFEFDGGYVACPTDERGNC